jgi:1-acyl-sn-glycerol-3-phosphate acyltransferase
MKRKNVQRIVRWLLRRLTHLEFQGEEHLPDTGGVIIITNHLSRLDIPVLFMLPKRGENITALVTDKYKSYPLLRWFTDSCEGIWIDRSKADFTAFREALYALNNGKALGISPEGTRSTTGMLQEGKSGAALLALKANVPIIPVGLCGTEDSVRKMVRLQQPYILGRFGPAFTLPSLEMKDRENWLKQATDEMMCRIAALLPEKYHGFYSGHPRIKELRLSGGY